MFLGTDIPKQINHNEIPTPLFRKMVFKLSHWNQIPKKVQLNEIPMVDDGIVYFPYSCSDLYTFP